MLTSQTMLLESFSSPNQLKLIACTHTDRLLEKGQGVLSKWQSSMKTKDSNK